MALIFIQCENEKDSVELIEKNEEESVTTQEFDRAEMLAFWVDNIIIPSLENLEISLNSLEVSVTEFTDNPTSGHLDVLKRKWLAAYIDWQYVEMFDIGLAEEIYYKNRMNLYPVNVTRVENNVVSKNYDLDTSSQFTAQGFSALDYLIFGIGDNEDAILSLYANRDLNYSHYLNDVTDKMIALTLQVKTQWEGDYRDTFIQSIDNTATSSLNKLVNDFVFYYEKGYRAHKIGIPAGIFSTSPLPDRIEAYHGEIYSKILALEATSAIKQFFNGTGTNDPNTTGLGLKHYLDYIEADLDTKLSTRINEKFDLSEDKINDLNANFKQQINEDNNAMLLTYDLIQSNVVLLKVDMLQKLNVSVDYADADGD